MSPPPKPRKPGPTPKRLPGLGGEPDSMQRAKWRGLAGRAKAILRATARGGSEGGDDEYGDGHGDRVAKAKAAEASEDDSEG